MARKGKGLSVPFALEHVWNGFCALAGTRGNNGFGLNPITFSEIAAWDALTGARLTPWEVELIKRVDSAVLPILNTKDKDREQEPDTVAAADDIAGVRSVMSILKARAKAVYGKRPANS